MASKQYFYGLGRRKSSTARVRLYTNGKGSIIINDKPANEYFHDSQALLNVINLPFSTLDKSGTYDITAKVSGGGMSGQADAISLGIAKSLVSINEDNKSTLKKADLLSRDPRDKERKKFGLKGARKRRQFTKR